MKIYYLLLFMAFSPWMLSAQIEKGTFRLGATTSASGFGAIPFFYESPQTNNATVSFTDDLNYITLSPNIGYFIANRTMIGLQANVISAGDDLDRINLTSITPNIRYYFTNGKWKPYVEARAGIVTSKFEEERKNQFTFGGQGGVAFFLNDKVSLDIFADFSQYSYEDDDIDDSKVTSSFTSFGVGFSIFL